MQVSSQCRCTTLSAVPNLVGGMLTLDRPISKPELTLEPDTPTILMSISRKCVPFTPFEGDLAKSTIAIVTAGGVHLKDQEPFNICR